MRIAPLWSSITLLRWPIGLGKQKEKSRSIRKDMVSSSDGGAWMAKGVDNSGPFCSSLLVRNRYLICLNTKPKNPHGHRK